MNKIKNTLVFLFVFQCFFLFSQQLEEQIYNAVDTFNSRQNQASFQQLVNKEKQFQSRVSTADEQLALVYLQCNKAYYLKQIGNSKEAIASYENAWKNYSKDSLKGYDIIEYCLKPLGNLYTISKDYTNAENTINQYIFLADKDKNQQQKIAGIINLSILYQSIGKHNDVLKLTKNTLKLSKISNIQRQKLTNISTKSKIALNEISSTDEIPKISDNTYQYHLNSSQLALKNKNFKLAKEHFSKAKKYFLEQQNITARMLAKLYVYEAQLFLQFDEVKKATTSLFNAIHTLLPNHQKTTIKKEDLYAENTFIDIFDLLGSTQENTVDALYYYDLSFYVSSLLNDEVSSQEAKIINQSAERKRSEKCINLLFDEYSYTSDNKFLEQAFQYAERSKTSVLKDMIRKKSLLELHPNDSLLLAEQELLLQQEFTTNELINERFGKSRVTILNDISKKLSNISIQLKTIKNKIIEKYPATQESDFTFSNLKNKLIEDGAVLIEYFYGKEAIYQFVISSKKSNFHKIELSIKNKATISKFIHSFDNASVINNDVKSFTNNAYQAYKTLNLEVVSKFENLIIVPDGLINFIPFEALLSKNIETTKFEEMPFLVKKYTISYNSNVEFYLSKRQKSEGKKMLGIFPVFKNSNKELRYSIDEANALKKEMKIDLLMDDEATKSVFINTVSDYNILHLSTHASSGDFMRPASIEFYDNVMPLNELYSLDLNANLVVLSACETGVGKLQRGEGAMSIARGFQYAGAKNILFSLWQINDKSTSEIMRLFYENYKKSTSKTHANRASKIAYLKDENISNIKKSPYYWSAFVYYGNVDRISENSSLKYIFIGLGFLLIFTFLFLKNKKLTSNYNSIF